MVQGCIWLLGHYFELFPHNNKNNNSREALTCACAAGKIAADGPKYAEGHRHVTKIRNQYFGLKHQPYKQRWAQGGWWEGTPIVNFEVTPSY